MVGMSVTLKKIMLEGDVFGLHASATKTMPMKNELAAF